MQFVIFGLTVSSSWGNGHATLWRGLIQALTARGHRVAFFERDVPYYAAHRDLTDLGAGATLLLYDDFPAVRARAAADAADVAIVTSFCPDASAATRLIADSRARLRVFYDLDTPVTLEALSRAATSRPGDAGFPGPQGLASYDLVLSYTGGEALTALRDRLHARRVEPLYGWADPAVYRPVAPRTQACALSYLGTYADDRQAALLALFMEPARRRPDLRFVIGGALYPPDFPWADNIFFVHHLPPAGHPAFFAASGATLNVTRAAMARMGWCPSGRLFEAAGCGTPIISDRWPGIETFFEPGREILLADTTDDVLAVLDMPAAARAAVAARGRQRMLAEHTADSRAGRLLALCDAAMTADA